MKPDSMDSSDEEWEEVEESEKHEEEDIVKPSESVEVELDVPDAVKKKRKKEEWEREMVETSIRRAVKRFDKEMQLAMHKVHLLCLLAMGMRLNQICNGDELQALVFSILPEKYTEAKPKHVSAIFLTRFIHDFAQKFDSDNGLKKLLSLGILRLRNLELLVKKAVKKRKLTFKLDLVMIFVIALRAMGLNTRLVLSWQPVPLKSLTEKQKENIAKTKAANKNGHSPSKRPKTQPECDIPQVDGAGDTPRITRSRTAKKTSMQEDNSLKQIKSAKSRKQTSKSTNLCTKKFAKEEEKNLKRKSETLKSARVVLKRENLENMGKKPILQTVKRGSQETDKIDETPSVKPLANNTKAKRQLRTKAKRKIANRTSDDRSDSDNDFKPVMSSESETSDFEVEPKKATPKRKQSKIQEKIPRKGRNNAAKKVLGRRSVGKKVANGTDYYDEWVEVYSEQENKWICLDIFHCVVNHPEEMEKRATPTMHYVLGFENGGHVKDITARYASKWMTDTRKLRVGIADKDWWKETLSPYSTPNSEMDNRENRQMQEHLLAQPIPTTISAFKNHPLFGLRRHLLKYEAIYPPDVPTVGFIRGEEIFPRSAIHCLHTRDKWLQEARVVKDGEEPYKMVASLWINMKLKQDMSTLSMPLFGKWQTEPFVPPIAKDGKVPRNQYGNVDLFVPDMMPVGCVQLRLAGLHKIARKLDIDIATAVTGFDSHSGYPHPVTDGYVVCEEHEETLVAAWTKSMRLKEKRKRGKRGFTGIGNSSSKPCSPKSA